MATPYPFPGPVPPYTNLPIESQYYNPSQFFISNITLGTTTTVTMTENMNYVIGQLVRLIIPPMFGCRQLNEQLAYVISIPSANQVTLQLDSSRNVNQFTSSSYPTQPQILAVGDINQGLINSTGRVMKSTNIPGSFINVSP